MIGFACPHCGQPLQVEEDQAGKEVTCRHCGKAAAVPPARGGQPAPVAVAVATPASPPASGKPAPAPKDEPLTPTMPPTPAAARAAPTAPKPAAAAPDGMDPPTHFDETQVWVSRSIPGGGASGLNLNAEAPRDFPFLDPPEGPGEIGRLGPYRILKVLGAGGMGVVFQAEDPMLRRTVAIKAMLPEIAAKPANRERFMREAQATAAIEHDHIVTIYQVAESKGVPYLVMQFLQGESLEVRMHREGTLPVAEVLRIGRETAEGLAAAHDRGLIHRDIKPGNIWLEGARGRVRILDFGLARATSEDSHLTQSGMIMGTPAFMAPEQARSQGVDHRSDLFSLGCVLYRLSTGQLPFRGADTVSMLVALVVERPRPVLELNAAVPPVLSDLIMKLLAKLPEERPPSAHTVVEVLSAIERGQPVAPRARYAQPELPTAKILDIDDSALRLEPEADLPEEDLPAPLPVDQPVDQAEAPAAPAEEEEEPALPVERLQELSGRVLGHFELGPVLGRGDYGVVFRAHDRAKDRTVALKILPPVFPQDEAERAHFIRTIKPMLRSRHPNVVSLYGAGKTRPYCWLALEYVTGEPLDRVLERLGATRKKGDWRRAFQVAVHIGRALDFAAQHHLEHSALTPAEVLWDEGEQRAKLSGLMGQKALRGSLLARQVRERRRRACLPYMSPEQLDGEDRGDELSDLYSLGAVVYQVLTGRAPFAGETSKETAEKIQKGGPAKPSQFVRGIPAELEWVVLTMLSKDRKYRFQTPSELLVYLERIALEHGVTV